ALPITTVTYNIWGEPETTTQTVGSASRTTTITHDAAGRVATTHATSTTGGALPTVTNKYGETTGALLEQSSTVEGKSQSIKSGFNTLAQLTSYTDAAGNITEYEYEAGQDARLKHLSDGKGNQSY